jgi:hypothetical protein
VTLNVKLEGVNECLAALRNLPLNVQRKHMRVAMNAAGGVLKTGAVSRVPQRTKLLKQSMSVKVTQKRSGEWYTVVGAKRGMKRALRLTSKGTTKALGKRATSNLKFTPGGGGQRYYDPARTAHLAEKGTRSHVVSVKNKRVLAGNGGIWGRRVTIKARGSRFLETTANTSGTAALAKATTKLREAVLSHANK